MYVIIHSLSLESSHAISMSVFVPTFLQLYIETQALFGLINSIVYKHLDPRPEKFNIYTNLSYKRPTIIQTKTHSFFCFALERIPGSLCRVKC